jgi:RNA polymerase sigma factor for flagellar operon FliA
VESPSDIAALIEDGRALVRSLALRIYRNLPVRVDLEDLIAYGELGLAEAARDFDSEQGAQFITFAYYRIRGAIYDGVAKMTWTSRARYRRLRYDRMANQVLESDEERWRREGQSLDPSAWFARTTQQLAVVYLASAMDSENDPMAGVVCREEEPSERLIHHETSEKLRILVTKLPAVESRLIQMVYFEGYTLQDAASSLGFSKSWASRLHAKILEELALQMRRIGMHE